MAKADDILNIYFSNKNPDVKLADIAEVVGVSREYVRQVVTKAYKDKEKYIEAKREIIEKRKELRLNKQILNADNKTSVFKLDETEKILMVEGIPFYRIIYRGEFTDKFYNKNVGQYVRLYNDNKVIKIEDVPSVINISYFGVKRNIDVKQLNKIRISKKNPCYNINPVLRKPDKHLESLIIYAHS